MKYFTSDQHFGHANIIKYCDRPYATYKIMDKALIDNWNSVIKDEDEVFVIGDFSLTRNHEMIRSLLEKLNGTKHLILGNHDELKPFSYVNCGFASVHTSLKIEDTIYLIHDPASAAVLKKDDILLCGHVHTLFTEIESENGVRVINVGVDVRDYKPVSLEELLWKRK